MTSVVISQPQLLPWPGFFELIASADVYVHLDDAQYAKGFINRVQIKHSAGKQVDDGAIERKRCTSQD